MNRFNTTLFIEYKKIRQEVPEPNLIPPNLTLGYEEFVYGSAVIQTRPKVNWVYYRMPRQSRFSLFC